MHKKTVIDYYGPSAVQSVRDHCIYGLTLSKAEPRVEINQGEQKQPCLYIKHQEALA